MKWEITDSIIEADKKLNEASGFLNLIRHVNPINLNDEKRDFFSNKKRNPFFMYRDPQADMVELKKQLEEIEIPDTPMGNILENVRKDFITRCDIILSIGHDDHAVSELTSKIYGWPNEGLVKFAEKIVNDYPNNPEELNMPSSLLKEQMKKTFSSLGMDNWKVKYSRRYLTRTKHKRDICISKTRLFSENDLFRLPIHEICVHAVRYENSYYQPLKIFGYGFPGFLQTEEGMAMYFEEKTGHSSKQIFRNYAGRVLAINCLKQKKDFRECFEYLNSNGFTEEQSWNLSVRAYRGGGFVKDHLYLEGYLIVKKFAEEGGNFKNLFVGKVGIEDLEIVNQFLKQGLINEPKYLPDFVE